MDRDLTSLQIVVRLCIALALGVAVAGGGVEPMGAAALAWAMNALTR